MRIRWIDAAPAILVLVVALMCPVCAHPRYYQETGRACSHCHIEPCGGSGLTSDGREYGQSGTLDDMHTASTAMEPPTPDQANCTSNPCASHPEISLDEPDTNAGEAGLLAAGFGITSFCLLAYRRSR